MSEQTAPISPLDFFVMRIGDVEVRTCDKMLLTKQGPHERCEIVKWAPTGKTCWTIACWDMTSEGFELRFIGARPFDDCEPATFFKLAKAGQDHLDDYYEKLNA